MEATARGYSDKAALILLLHDASEAYICDIVRPVKKELPWYFEIEKKLQDTILVSFGIDPNCDERRLEKDVDDAMLYYEFLAFMDEKLADAPPKLVSKPDFSDKSFDEIEDEFRALLKKLTKKN
jgi:hypothetical protein